MPWSAAPDKEGNVWMPYYGGANKIGKLDPETGSVKEYDVPNENAVAIHSAYPAVDGNVWLAEFGINKIGKFDPKSEKLIEFADAYTPGKEGLVAGGSKHTVRVGADGIAWASGSRISRLDPKTGKFTDFSEPAYGVIVDKDGNCWFSEYNAGGKIGRIDGKTLEVKTWNPPGSNTVYSRRLQIDSDGMVWFSQSGAGQIGRFDPKTETFKNYALPGPNASPYAMNLDRNHDVWYSSEYLDEVGRLNTGDRESDRVSLPAFGDYFAGIFSRCAGAHVVRHALQQQGRIFLSGGAGCDGPKQRPVSEVQRCSFQKENQFCCWVRWRSRWFSSAFSP